MKDIIFLLKFINKSWFQAKGAVIGDVFLAADCAFHDRRIPIPVSVPIEYHFLFFSCLVKDTNGGSNINCLLNPYSIVLLIDTLVLLVFLTWNWVVDHLVPYICLTSN